MQRETAEKRVEALNAEKRAQAATDDEFAKQEEKSKQVSLQIDELKKELIKLKENIQNHNSQAALAESLTKTVVKDYWQWVDKAAELLVAIDGFVRVDNSTSIADFKKRIENIVEKPLLAESIKAARARQREKSLSDIGKISSVNRSY